MHFEETIQRATVYLLGSYIFLNALFGLLIGLMGGIMITVYLLKCKQGECSE